MKLLFDQNLSPCLAARLADLYPASSHVYLLGLGRWQKVIKQGNSGEVHYFEHHSGHVAGVKFFSKTGTS